MAETEQRWAVEQALALAQRPAVIAAAQPLAVPGRWHGIGCDDHALWGSCTGSGSEPYDVIVDHLRPAFRCTCPSRAVPCKHALALLMLWCSGQVPTAVATGRVSSWIAKQRSAAPAMSSPAASPADDVSGPSSSSAAGSSAAGSTDDDADAASPREASVDPDRARDERVARMSAGLLELDRWLDDRARTGLADPALARYATWDALAARLVDAQVGALANRVRRLAGVVGVGPRWHEDVLAELGILHLLAHAGRHLGDLPPVLADAVAMALGWQVRQAEVLAGAPLTDRWAVMGRSDVREDRIEVRRVWLRGTETGRWAMVLSFAAYRQSLDESFEVGTEVPADLFFYPGAGLRALVGRRHGPAVAGITDVHGLTRRSVAATATTVGAAIALEPWLEHYPVVMMATPTRVRGARRWVLADSTGSLPIAGWFADGGSALATLLACSAGVAVLLTCEWTPAGLVPLTVHLSDRSVDIGPVADESFVASE